MKPKNSKKNVKHNVKNNNINRLNSNGFSMCIFENERSLNFNFDLEVSSPGINRPFPSFGGHFVKGCKNALFEMTFLAFLTRNT